MNNKVKNIEDLLFELYYSTNEPTAYSSCERLYKYIKNKPNSVLRKISSKIGSTHRERIHFIRTEF